MLTSNPRLLFVYGTLMSASTDAMGRESRGRLDKSSRVVGQAIARGYLFDLGAYPGFVPTLPGPAEDEVGRVFGELRELTDSNAVFAWLDLYEGIRPGAEELAEYRRTVVSIAHVDDDGTEIAVSAWIYVYQRTLDGVRLLPDGVWRG